MKKITVVGVGALGSHVVLMGRNLEAAWKVIDFDRVERKNTLSQFHTRMGVGRNKAQAISQAVQGLFGLRVEAVPHKLTADNAEALLGGSDLIIDCLDNAQARRVVQAFARANGVPCLHGALAANGEYGQVLWDEHFEIDEGAAGAATCEDGEHLPFIVGASAVLVQSAQRFLRDGHKSGFHVLPGGQVRQVC